MYLNVSYIVIWTVLTYTVQWYRCCARQRG